MFQIEEFVEAKLVSHTSRSERHGDEDVPAVSLALELTVANTMLDRIDPKIRESLYKAVDDQEPLPGVEQSTPVLRCNSFDRHTLPTKYDGWTLTVDDGIDETASMTFGGCKLDKFVIEAKQGGTIVLRFRVGTNDLDAERSGFLGMHVGQSVWIRLSAPETPADVIDGTTEAFERDHPADATDMFLGTHGPDDEDDEFDDEPPEDDEPEPPDVEIAQKPKRGGKAKAVQP